MVLGACGDDVVVPVRDAGPILDAGPVDAFRPDTGPACDSDEDCEDGIECTRNLCRNNVCGIQVDQASCDDGIFCNGVEICDVNEGCMAGPPETCNDNDVCTIDRCDEEAKMCRRSSRDFDEDGEADFFCEGGTDCDDRDPTRGATLAEVCGDGVDNDCDEVVDEEECGRPAHDTCDDPLDVSAGGIFDLSTDGARGDHMIGCAPSGRRDVVLTFTLPEPREVSIVAEGESVTSVALRSDCTDRTSESECNAGFPGQLRIRELPAGTYFVIVADVGGEVEVEVAFDEPEPPAVNETCDAPIDVSAGGVFMGSFVGVANDLDTGCGSSNAPDLTYGFTLAEEQDVLISATSLTRDSVAFSVRGDCEDEATEVRCARGAPAGTRIHRLGAGSYSIIVEGSTFRAFDFNLSVAFEAPTDAPNGDACGNPISLPLNTTVMGSLGDKQDDIDLSCGFHYRDAVYEFELMENADVLIAAEGAGTSMSVALQGTCGDEETQQRCSSGRPGRIRVRDLSPGTYTVIVESFSGMGFDLSVETAPPTTPIPVDGNGLCGTAHPIPPTGGLFSGSTASLLNDLETGTCGSMARSNDAAFSLTLTEERRVRASTEGSDFDTVLHLHTETCETRMETACDDDGGEGSTSLIERVLPAGTYYFVVDGWGTSNDGDYLFEVVLSDP